MPRLCRIYKVSREIMDNAFWIQRWQDNRTGFHLPEVNQYLVRHWPAVAEQGGKVFVPLSGKSLDLLWLEQQGHKVTGCELSELAVNAFFSENRRNFSVVKDNTYTSGDVSIHCGDFFGMQPDDLDDVDIVYDRAALVAMPEDMRADYVEQLLTLAPEARILLVTLEYDQHKKDGPPFSVSGQELELLFGETHDIELLEDVDVLPAHQHFAEQGIDYLHEKVYLLKPFPDSE